MIVIVIDALSMDQFGTDEWPKLKQLATNGVIGLMNARTSASSAFGPAGGHVTIGAGVRSPAGSLSGYAFDASSRHNGVTMGDLFSGLTGHTVASNSVVVLGMPQLQALAALHPEGARPGTLGHRLTAKGLRVAIIGNADVPDPARVPSLRIDPDNAVVDAVPLTLRRHGALMAMDYRGVVPLGTVDTELLTYDVRWPFGVRTDYDTVWRTFTSFYEEADFIVVELGDLARLDLLSDWISGDWMSELRNLAARRIDGLIGQIAQWSSASKATVAVISPSPPTAVSRRNFLLTPFVWTRLGSTEQQQPQLATSRTTRRAGIITNADVTAGILASFGEADESARAVHGADRAQLRRDLPFTVKPPEDNWKTLQLLYERVTATHSLRAPVVRTFVMAAIAVFSGWVLWMTYMNVAVNPRMSTTTLVVWRWLMLLLSSTPLSILLLPLFPSLNTTGTSLILFSLICGLAAAFNSVGDEANENPQKRLLIPRHVRVMDGFTGIALSTATLLVLDVWLGAPLIKSSVLGYDPIVGARFYGIGNEFMGVLIGTTLIGTTGLLDRLTPRPIYTAVVVAAYGLVCVTLASPTLGANVGGTIAGVVGFGVTTVLLLGKRLSWKAIVIVGIAVGGVLAMAGAYDLLFGGEQLSHLGQTVQLVQRHGLSPLLNIVTRKLSMNAKLLRWTIWAQVFIVSLAVSAFALYRPTATIRRIEHRHPLLLHGIRGSVIAALVALIANDSGVVAAATMMIPVTATLVYLVLLQRA